MSVASPPSVAAEAPPQVVSNGADVGDAPQDADATVQTYGGVDLADTDDIDDYFADVIAAPPSARPPVIAAAVPKPPPPFIDIETGLPHVQLYPEPVYGPHFSARYKILLLHAYSNTTDSSRPPR